jgi:AraC-like DNA-binding protein
MEIWQNLNFDADSDLDIEGRTEPVILFAMSGKIAVCAGESQAFSLSEHEMTICPPKETIKITALQKTEIVVCEFPAIALFSDTKLVNELLPLVENDRENEKKLPVDKTIVRFLLLLLQYMKRDIFPEYLYEIKRRELFILLCSCYTKVDLANFFSAFLSNNANFKQFVINNYYKVKNVNELASKANISTSGFIKKFRKTFNESPYKWLQQQKAKSILKDINIGKKSLQELAVEYRFSSYQHFSLFCKKYFHCTPTSIYGKNLLEK